MDWKARRFLEVKDLYAKDGPFEGLVKKDLCYRLLDGGKIASVRIGGRRLVLRESVEAYLAGLIEEAMRPPDAAAPSPAPQGITQGRRPCRHRPSRLVFGWVPP